MYSKYYSIPFSIKNTYIYSSKETSTRTANHCIVKFIYSEKATKFSEISTVDLSYVSSASQIYGGDFARFGGLLRIYELYDCFSKVEVKATKI